MSEDVIVHEDVDDNGSQSSGDESKHTYQARYNEYEHEEEVERVKRWDKFREVGMDFMHYNTCRVQLDVGPFEKSALPVK